MPDARTLLQAGAAAAPFAKWYLESAFGPDVNTRIVSWLFEPRAVGRVCKDVKANPKVRAEIKSVPVRRLKQWYRAGRTRDDLIAQGADAFDRLVESLIAEFRHSRRGRMLTRMNAEVIVEAVIDCFIRTLDPADATAVTTTQILGRLDESANRSEEQHQEVLAALSESPHLGAAEWDFTRLPGPARELAEGLGRTPAVRDLLHVITRGSDQATAIRQMTADVPQWLATSDEDTLLLAAELARAYGERASAGDLLILASEKSPNRVALSARAASEYYTAGDADTAEKTLGLARRLGTDLAVDAVAAQLDDDAAAVLTALPEAEALKSTFLTGLRLAALAIQRPANDVIAFARLALDRFPHVTSLRVQLARALLERASQAGSSTRDADFIEARDLALEARDQLRVWGGDSGQAVHFACLAAARLHDLELVIRLGFTPPEGEALEVEASHPEVRISVVQAALMMDDVDTARAVDELGDGAGFHDAYIHAEVLVAAGAEPAEVEAAFHVAWDAAEDDGSRGLCLLAMSQAGVTDIPDISELKSPSDELHVLVESQQLLNAGLPREAVDRLRSVERTEVISSLLTAALIAAEDPEAAVAELRDDAARFNDPERLARAVELLLKNGQIPEASALASEALLQIPASAAGRRSFLRSVTVQDAAERQAWQDMVTRARAWVAESGAGDPTARWALAIALNNDQRPAEAWEEIQRHPRLQPRNPVDAQLWTTTAASQEPGAGTCRRIIELVDEFDDEQLEISAAIAFFITMGDSKCGEPGDDVIARFQELMTKHAVGHDVDPNAPLVVYRGTPENLIAQLEPRLAARASLLTDMSKRVRDGYPYGLVAAAAHAEYVATLIHRAAGFLPAVAADPAVHERERIAARAALQLTVSLDPSVVVIAWYIQPYWPKLRSSFSRLELTGPARRDALASVERFSQRADGHLVYEEGLGVVATDVDAEAQARLLAHAEWVAAELGRTSVSERTDLSHLSTDAVLTDRYLSWLSALDQAKELGHSLWSDDLGLRSLAEVENVPAFGTVALLEVLREDESITEPELQTALRSLREEYVVDLPLDHDWMLLSAASTDWVAGAAGAQFSRAAAWADDVEARRMWGDLVIRAASRKPLLAVGWLNWSAQGVVKARTPQVAFRTLMELTLFVCAVTEYDRDVLAAAAAVVRRVATEAGLPSPSEPLVALYLHLLTDEVGAEEAGRRLSDAAFEPPEREALRKLLFRGS